MKRMKKKKKWLVIVGEKKNKNAGTHPITKLRVV